MINVKSKSWPPPRYIRTFYRGLLKIGQWLSMDIEVIDGLSCYRFRAKTVREFNRCLKLFLKEPGTVEWIKTELKSGQIFYDIGANIGIYSIIAAKQTGLTGKVYAFEPHAATFSHLSNNIIRNDLRDVVIPFSLALDSETGFFPFNCFSIDAGFSNNQLSPHEEKLANASIYSTTTISELKYATTIDALIGEGLIQPAHHIKIDVDGNELRILEGMSTFLKSTMSPLTIQVEVDAESQDNIKAFLLDHRYRLVGKHFSRGSMKRLRSEVVTANPGGNAVFKRLAHNLIS